MAVQAIFNDLNPFSFKSSDSKLWPGHDQIWEVQINSLAEGLERLNDALKHRRTAREGEDPRFNPVLSFRMCLDILTQSLQLAEKEGEKLSIESKRQLLTIINETYFSAQWFSYDYTWSNFDENLFPKNDDFREFEIALSEEDIAFLKNEIKENKIPTGSASKACTEELEAVHQILDLAEHFVLKGESEETSKEKFGAEYGEYCRLRGVSLLRIAERLLKEDPKSEKAKLMQEKSFEWIKSAYEIWIDDQSNPQLMRRCAMNFAEACAATGRFEDGIKTTTSIINSWLNGPTGVFTRLPEMVGYTYCSLVDLIGNYFDHCENKKSPLSDSRKYILTKNAGIFWRNAVKLLNNSKIQSETIINDTQETLAFAKKLKLERRSAEEIFPKTAA